MFFAGGMAATLEAADQPGPTIPREEIIRTLAPGASRFVQRAMSPATNARLDAREVLTQALVLAEAKTETDRIDPMLALAEPLQDRNKTSSSYGNFRWYSDDKQVTDRNAVDFCMQAAAPLWILHRDSLPPAARERLKALITFGIDGLMGHKINPNYTNIALMNAGNLILLGEAMDRPDAVKEGGERLDRFLTTMWENGIHEYDSPTYYGVDLDNLQLIATLAKNAKARQQASALLEYFWTDVALNWFPASQKLAGARSRDYDYLRGVGALDNHLLASGWLPASGKEKVNNILSAFTKWYPPAKLWQLAMSPKPRLIESIWGPAQNQARACWICPDIALSAAGMGYGGRMDFPMCVDLPGSRNRPRIYVLPDGRHDPYGKAKILEAANGHMKSLHLSPFWAAAQRRSDALGMFLYRDGDLPKDTTSIETHVVLPKDVDGIWIGGQKAALDGKPFEHALASGQPLILRQGTAAVGIKVVWAVDTKGREAAAHLVDDGNPHGALRLTIDHQWKSALPTSAVGAAIWIRAGSGLATDEAFRAWSDDFAASAMNAQSDTNGITVRVTGQDGPLSITAKAPFTNATVEPSWARHLLALDGKDIGRELLANVETVRLFHERRSRVKPISVAEAAEWEAEDGLTTSPVEVASDAEASGGKFTWMPVLAGTKPDAAGSVFWSLDVAQAGEFYLWGRVRAATPANDSFFVGLEHEGKPILGKATWQIGVHKDWTWVRFTPEKAKTPTPISIPAGRSELTVLTREPGAQIDRLFLTVRADESPR